MTENRVCCFTGHRDFDRVATEQEKLIFRTITNNVIRMGYTTFMSGGALGFDMAAAEYILWLKAQGLGLRLVMVLPCADQTSRWNIYQKRRHDAICRAADEIVCLHDRYVDGCMHERNRYMVDNSSACIAYCGRNSGGTAYTLQYAKKRERMVFNVHAMARM